MTRGKNDHPQAYGDETYWDSRYRNDSGSFDWYQRYTGLSPLVNKYVLQTNRILMVGCGNAVISEDMVNDGYQDIINVDISSVVIEAMQKKYKDVPQLSYIRLDVREMNIFKEAMFDAVIDKEKMRPTEKNIFSKVKVLTDTLTGFGWLCKCGASAPNSVARMLDEVFRVLKPGGVYMLITYGDPRVRMPHLRRAEMNWSIALHIIPRPGSVRAAESSLRPVLEPLVFNEDGSLGPKFPLEDPDLHYVYICTKEVPVEGARPGTIRTRSQ